MKERNTKRLKLGNKNSSEENVFAAKFNPLCKKKRKTFIVGSTISFYFSLM